MSDAGEQKLRTYLERATAALRQTKQRLEQLEAKATEPIAIVSMACRLPGDVYTPEQLWSLLEAGNDAVTPLPTDRGWALDGLYDSNPNAVGRTYTRGGGFLCHPGMFDSSFFGISPREATGTDPQQRILLELSWEVVERAGMLPAALHGSEAGVFVGICYNDYASVAPDPHVATDGYATLGNLSSLASGRIAYTLGLHGPAVTLDSACSSSLVAIHLACQALREQECDLAFAGGATVFSTTEPLIAYSRLRTLSPDGRCKAFGAGADGAGWAEGAGMVLLERLSDAQAKGHPILAVLRGSAINQDGRSQGLTAPNGLAQRRVIQAALTDARLQAADIDLVEAHGTGTALGDPIEANALLATYGRHHDREQPLWLGSLKSNIAHTQAAAGVAGLIKLVMALDRQWMPRTLHVEQPSPHVDWSDGTLALLERGRAWPRGSRPRRAAVSSFGISGTNAHVIVEEAPDVTVSSAASGELPIYAWVVSARSEAALRGQAERLLAHLADSHALADIGFSLATSRTHFERRAVIVGQSLDRLRSGLESLAAGVVDPACHQATAILEPKLAVMFTGQGSQRPAMARTCYEKYDLFRRTFDAICERFDQLLDGSVRDVVFGTDDRLDQTVFTQPALFAVEVALFRLFESWGVRPSALLGHSIGELVAAHVAGIFSLDDACRLVAARGKLMQALPGGGAMASIQATESEVLEVLDRFANVDVAGINGPMSTVVSGDESSVDVLAQHFVALGRKVTRLSVSHAFHSRRMDPMLAAFGAIAREIQYRPPTLPIASNVLGRLVSGDELCSPDYWIRHVREGVRFLDGVRALERAQIAVALELGPRGVLSSMVPGCLEQDGSIRCVPTLRNDKPEPESLAAALGILHCLGVGVDWPGFFAPATPQRVDLPTYAFHRSLHWSPAPTTTTDLSASGLDSADHPLLGAATHLAHDDSWLLAGRLSLASQPWLAEHVVFGRVLLPGTAFVDLALHAASLAGFDAIDELTIETPLTLAAAPRLVQVSVGDPDGAALQIHVRDLDAAALGWTRVASGRLVRDTVHAEFDLVDWPPGAAVPVDLNEFYARTRERGLDYGATFRGLRAAWSQGSQWFVEVELPEPASEVGHHIHPALLDAALHILTLALPSDEVPLPTIWSGVQLWATGARSLRVRLTPTSSVGGYSLEIADAGGAPVARIRELFTRATKADDLRGTLARRSTEGLFHLDWQSVPGRDEPRTTTERWSLRGDADLTSRLAALGLDIERVRDADEVSEHADLAVFADHASDPLAAATELLGWLQRLLDTPRLARVRPLILTRRAVSTSHDDPIEDLAGAALWGLVRAAQLEAPSRAITIFDIDDDPASLAVLRSALALDEPQLAFRKGELLAPRLAAPPTSDLIDVPLDIDGWHLDLREKGTFENLFVSTWSASSAPLSAGQVRVGVRATGLNFRDVLNALGMYPGEAGPLGYEGAGVVLEVGSGVTDLVPGDRVFGMLHAGFAPRSVVDRRWLARMPASWTFAEAAASPLVFLTAYYALIDLAALQPGERILIHAGAGGVGMAATQLARHLGAEVFTTASHPKWAVLRELGFDEKHLADSRSTVFEREFMASSDGRGMDVILDALAGEFVDASLRLLPSGGRFVEMGKTDIRDAEEVARQYPGVHYRAFDLNEAGPDRIQAMLRALVELFDRAVLRPLPLTCFDLREAPRAFRYVGQAKHIGKVVLTMPRRIPAEGSVLVTGATGGLGPILARHLVREHDVRHLVLISRRGPAAEHATELVRELEGLGARVRLVALDASDRAGLSELLESIPSEHPLSAVFHVAGVLDDRTLGSLGPDQLASVFDPKVRAAIDLHELTRHADLAAFVLFSSIVGTIGAAGQANYAAANAFLDALACHRSSLGLPALSLGWGPWASGGMAARMSEADRARLERRGMPPLALDDATSLLDAALERPEAHLLPVKLDAKAMASASPLPAPLRSIVRSSSRRVIAVVAAPTSLSNRLAGMPEDRREPTLVELVRSEAATVLALSTEQLGVGQPLQEHGLDSLMAVELRNRLQSLTDLRLPSTLLFDHPTPKALARELLVRLVVEPPAPPNDTTRPTADSRPSMEADDAIAIVSLACRLPGGVTTPEQFWQLLVDERDVVSSFPTDRGWQLDGLYDPDPDRVGTTYARGGAFLDAPDQFDAGFFGISPREADAMDPQQRVLLELAWESLERAAIDPLALAGSSTGVFVGVCYHEYLDLAPDSRHATDGYALLGNIASTASGRIAYTLGLQGPALTVDTACSTSLVAIHLAAKALRDRECDLAIAGGATIFATPDPFIDFSRLKALSPDGRCKAFAADADGAGWAEGAGIVVLERVVDARAKGHEILAILRGSAVNQDGRSQGLTAPNGPAQQRVITAALASAHLAATDVDVVEAHGTGTRLGDPIEVGALQATYGRAHSPERPLWLGSVKSNIGHAQAASGVVSVIKMVLALRHGLLPRTLHCEIPSPHIDWDGKVALLARATSWPPHETPRRAAVSAFGISGTNAHVILEEGPRLPPPLPVNDTALSPILLSARSREALSASAGRLREFLLADPEPSQLALARTLALGRSHFDHRACIVAGTRERLLAALDALQQQTPHPNHVEGRAKGEAKLVFVFPGQGSQWPGMAKALLDESPAFRASIEACAEALSRHVEWSLLDVLLERQSAPSLERVDIVQPVLFAVMVSLAALWSSLGVTPDAVVGHSQGEIAAAHVAGMLSLDEACKVVALRSKVIADRLDEGAMAAVSLSASEVQDRIRPFGNALELAVDNGPASSVVSGTPAAIDALVRALDGEGVFARRVRVSYASHCSSIETIRAPLLDALGELHPRPGMVPMYSTVELGHLDGERLDSAYWYRNLRQPVRFAEAINATIADGHRYFVEISPHPNMSVALAGLLEAHPDRPAGAALGTLRRGEGGLSRALLALGELHCMGFHVDWPTYFAGVDVQTLLPTRALPTYPFQRRRHWLERHEPLQSSLAHGGHPLLGELIRVADDDDLALWQRELSSDAPTWLGEHRVESAALLPATGFVEMIVAAARTLSNEPDGDTNNREFEVRELEFRRALVLRSEPTTTQVALRRIAPSRWQATVSARMEGRWQVLTHAIVELVSGALTASPADLETRPGRSFDPAAFYDAAARRGVDYGPAFRGITELWLDEDGEQALARVALPSAAGRRDEFVHHPILLDACVQVGYAQVLADPDGRQLFVPVEIAALRIYGSTDDVSLCRATTRRVGDRIRTDLRAWSEAGELVVEIEGLVSEPLAPSRTAVDDPISLSLLAPRWIEYQPGPTSPAGCWLVLGANPQLARHVAAGLEARGATLRIGAIGPELGPMITELVTDALRTPLAGVLCCWGLDASSPGSLAWHGSLHAARALASHPTRHPPRLLMVVPPATSPENALVRGVGSAIHAEFGSLRPRVIELDVPLDDAACNALATIALADDDEDLLRIRERAVEAARLDHPAAPASLDQRQRRALGSRFRAELSLPGQLESLRLVPICIHDLAELELELEVLAVSLAETDLILRHGGTALGLACVGTIMRVGVGLDPGLVGSRVTAVIPGCLASHVVVPFSRTRRVSSDLALEDAARLASGGLLGRHIVAQIGRARAGDRVLVIADNPSLAWHCTTSALQIGAEVFVITRDAELREDLEVLATARVADTLQAAQVVAWTKGDGADLVVIETLRDIDLQGLVRAGAIVVEVGESGPRTRVQPDALQAIVDPVAAFEVVSQRLLDPPPSSSNRGSCDIVTTAQLHDIGRRPSNGRDRVAILRGSEAPLVTFPASSLMIDRDASYVVVGEGPARQFARWLAERGAGQIVLIGGLARDEGLAKQLRHHGAQVVLAEVDLEDLEATRTALNTLTARPLRGITFSPTMLAERPLIETTPEHLHDAIRSALAHVSTLHRASETLELDFFVLHGSASTWLPSLGRAANTMVGAAMGAIVGSRRRAGLPGLALAWGVIEGDSSSMGLSGRGLLDISAEQHDALLDRLVSSDALEIAPCPFEVDPWTDYYPETAGWPFLDALRASALIEASSSADFVATLTLASPSQRIKFLLDRVMGELAKVVRTDTDQIDPHAPFTSIGIDSLMGVELRNRLKSSTGFELPSTAIWTHPTPEALARHLASLVAEPPAIELPNAPKSTEAMPTESHSESSDAAPVVEAADADLLSELEELEGLLDD